MKKNIIIIILFIAMLFSFTFSIAGAVSIVLIIAFAIVHTQEVERNEKVFLFDNNHAIVFIGDFGICYAKMVSL